MFNSLLYISRRQALLFCLLLAFFELLTYIASDAIMPGMLAVVADFQAEPHYVPWSLNAYLLGGVAFQWLLGPLSDCHGRRPLLLAGSALFAIACVITPFTVTIEQFTALRFIQGMGLGFVVVVSYPALQESFNEADAIRLIAIIANIALLSPLLGPLLGSVLLTWISWQSLFILLAAFAALCTLGLLRWMPETLGVTRRDASTLARQPFNLKSLARTYGELLRNRRFLAGCAALGLTGLPLMAWIALSPLLLVKNLDMSNLEYALWQLPIFGALIAGNITLNFIADKYVLSRLLFLSSIPLFAGLVIALISTLLFDSIYVLAAGLGIYAFGLGICNATLYRLTLFSSSHGMGSVSAMLGMISVGIFSLGGTLLALLGAGESLVDFIVLTALPALVALLLIKTLLTRTDEPVAA
ncbi:MULTISPECIES: MFS transporter [unclassified Leclercia]|uniref:MFS transporter n=1 Tax=Leclercia barmai TaxID=2785629 RepID=A0ABS7S280_9ENTR|nr:MULTISPECIES: MFS transporter [unclassified Leclercia]MBZ0059661.1 MFS transporter [Leclercia sp. EMC7]MCM5695188.1 MFS transporter [Leclercia sp. LTM01]MCM5699596.1 MFS transporter [Leclercia sp. LTM14]